MRYVLMRNLLLCFLAAVLVSAGAAGEPLQITDHGKIVVGAGSVVTKDVPAMTVVAGNPARIIKTIENK